MIQNKLELILLVYFNMHIVIKLCIEANTKDFKQAKNECTQNSRLKKPRIKP